MRIGLLGDIHANLPALEAVLRAAKSNGIDELLITGDFIGYYFWPSEIFKALDKWKFTAVRGNHEEMLIIAKDNPSYLKKITSKYGNGLEIALKTMGEKRIQWIQSLPHPLSLLIKNQRVILCHGSPWSVSEYIYQNSSSKIYTRLGSYEADWIILGHTHYQFIRKEKNVTVVNPGSVGQSRNGICKAHWAILDTQSRKIILRAEKYNIDAVIKYARKIQPEIKYLAKILERKTL